MLETGDEFIIETKKNFDIEFGFLFYYMKSLVFCY